MFFNSVIPLLCLLIVRGYENKIELYLVVLSQETMSNVVQQVCILQCNYCVSTCHRAERNSLPSYKCHKIEPIISKGMAETYRLKFFVQEVEVIDMPEAYFYTMLT